MSRIHSIQVFPLTLPFRVSFNHSLAARSRMSSVLVILRMEDGLVGYGEGTPRDYVTGESLAETISWLEKSAKSLLEADFHSIPEIERLLSGEIFASKPSARCALELAMLDILGKQQNQSVVNLLGEWIAPEIVYSSVITSDSPEKVAPLLKQSAQMGLRQIKLKLGADLSQNLAIANLARTLVPDAELRADINAGWTFDQALAQIPPLAESGISLFEQPMKVTDQSLYPALHAKMHGIAEIMIDESLVSSNDVDWFYTHGGTDRFLLKISKMGGILPTLRLAREARAHGIRSHLGCHVGESSLLSAAGRIAAAHFPFETVEGSFGTLLLEQDLNDRPLQFGKGGLASVVYSSLPGLGVEVLEDRIA